MSRRFALPSLRTLLLAPTEDTLIQAFRYLFVGGMAFLVDYGTLVALKEIAGFHYLVANSLSFLLGLATNYALSVRWVFASRKMGNRYVEFLVFGAIGLVGLGVNDLVMWACTDHLGTDYRLSKLAAAGVAMFWNFFARKLALFRRES
jgi:putative flippase GtrA